MPLVRWDPLVPDIARLMGLLDTGSARELARFSPTVEMREQDDHVVLELDLPGMGEDDIEVEVQDNMLTVSGERRREEQREEGDTFRSERMYGQFARSFTLPPGIDPDAIDASFDSGVLCLRVPKPEERSPRKISIGARSGEQQTIEGEQRGENQS
jgi:HSP20 family protein